MIDVPSNLHLSDVTESYIDSPMPSFIAPRSYANRKSAASETSYSILLERMEKLEQRDAARQEQFDKQERQLEKQERKIADLHLQVKIVNYTILLIFQINIMNGNELWFISSRICKPTL